MILAPKKLPLVEEESSSTTKRERGQKRKRRAPEREKNRGIRIVLRSVRHTVRVACMGDSNPHEKHALHDARTFFPSWDH